MSLLVASLETSIRFDFCNKLEVIVWAKQIKKNAYDVKVVKQWPWLKVSKIPTE